MQSLQNIFLSLAKAMCEVKLHVLEYAFFNSIAKTKIEEMVNFSNAF